MRNSMEQSPSEESNSGSAGQKSFIFITAEGSIKFLQEASAGTNTELDNCSPDFYNVLV
jgi:hypothetical protein